MVGVEFLIQFFQGGGPKPTGQLSGIGQLIAAAVHRQPLGGQPVHIHKAQTVGIIVLDLIDGEAVPGVVEEGLLPSLLVIHPVGNSLMKLRAFLPFACGYGKRDIRRTLIQFLPVKNHPGIFIHNGINGEVLFHQRLRPLFGQGKQIPLQIGEIPFRIPF